MPLIYVLFFSLLLFSSPSFAEFNATNRSINGTGETLPEHVCEIGARSLSCGINSKILVVAPTLSILTGISDFEMRYKFWDDVIRISAAAIAGTPMHFGGRIDLGFDFGIEKSHSVTLTLDSNWAARTKLPLKTYKPTYAYRTTHFLGGEYDFYHRGNVAYVGLLRNVPYIGYTWSWGELYSGVILSPGKVMYPLPYVYWRF